MIKLTKDYDVFKTLKGNRKVQKSHIQKIVTSIRKKNLLDVSPIIVNEKYEIIDGQHRFYACKELGIPVYYIIKNGLDLSDVELLNSSNKNRSLKDYLDAFIDLGKEEYVFLGRVKSTFPFVSLSVLIHIMQGLSTDGGCTPPITSFKTGEHTNKKKEEALQILKVCSDISTINKKARASKFILALHKGAKNGLCIDTFINKFEMNPTRLVNSTNTKGYQDIIQSIYNRKNRKPFYYK